MNLLKVALMLILVFASLIYANEILYPLLPLSLKLGPAPEPFPGAQYIPQKSISVCDHVRLESQYIEYLIDTDIQSVEQHFTNQFPDYCESEPEFKTIDYLLWGRCEDDSLCRIAQCDLIGYQQFFTALLKPMSKFQTQVFHFQDLASPTIYAPRICGGA